MKVVDEIRFRLDQILLGREPEFFAQVGELTLIEEERHAYKRTRAGWVQVALSKQDFPKNGIWVGEKEGMKSIVVLPRKKWKLFIILVEYYLRAAMREKGAALLHGAAYVTPGQGAILVLGKGGAGKTGYVIDRAMTTGSALLADDRLWVYENGMLESFLRYVVIKPKDVAKTGKLLRRYEKIRLWIAGAWARMFAVLGIGKAKKVGNKLFGSPVTVCARERGLLCAEVGARYNLEDIVVISDFGKQPLPALLASEAWDEWNSPLLALIRCSEQESVWAGPTSSELEEMISWECAVFQTAMGGLDERNI